MDKELNRDFREDMFKIMHQVNKNWTHNIYQFIPLECLKSQKLKTPNIGEDVEQLEL